MVVCGIDASTKSTGWSIFDGKKLVAYGVIKPEGHYRSLTLLIYIRRISFS